MIRKEPELMENYNQVFGILSPIAAAHLMAAVSPKQLTLAKTGETPARMPSRTFRGLLLVEVVAVVRSSGG